MAAEQKTQLQISLRYYLRGSGDDSCILNVKFIDSKKQSMHNGSHVNYRCFSIRLNFIPRKINSTL